MTIWHSAPQIVELPIKLRLTKPVHQKLAERAAESGTDLDGYVSAVVEQTASRPLSLAEISGSVYEKFLASGVTDEQLSEELERAKHELRAQRRARRAS